MLRSAIAVVSVCVLGGVAPARANTLDAPAVVMADKTGAFSYEAVFTAKDPVIIAMYEVCGLPDDNIVFDCSHADCFCPPPDDDGCPFDPGEELVIYVDGSLLNPFAGQRKRTNAAPTPSQKRDQDQDQGCPPGDPDQDNAKITIPNRCTE